MTKLRNILLIFSLLICVLAVWVPHAQAAPRLDGTEHTGSLAGDETWTAAGNPHYVNGSLTIPAGITLTLQPGVFVGSFNNYSYGQTGKIIVQGTLNAIGSPTNKIIFSSKDDSAPAQWTGIQVQGGTAVLTHVEVRNGGGGGGFSCQGAAPNATVCIQNSGSLTIDNGYFHANAPGYDVWDGVLAAYSANDGESLTLSVQSSRFEENGNSAYAAGYYPIVLDGPGIQLTMAGNTFANNQVNRILLLNNPMKTQAALTLPAQSGLEAYELVNTWTIPASQTLTLQPGVTLKAQPGAWNSGTPLIVEGTLLALGSDAQKITLDATVPTIGWGGLVVRGAGGLAQLSHVQILHGGTYFNLNNTGYQSNLVVENGARLELSDSRVANLVTNESNYHNGALKIVNSTAILTRNTIADNMPAGATTGIYPICISGPQSRLEMVDNTFSGNWINAVLLGSDGLAATINTLRPQTGMIGYDFGIPYADDGSTYYIQQPTGQLTVEAGTRLRAVSGSWGHGVYFEVRGQLHAMGTADAPVVFDYADGIVPASWGGIYVNGGTAEFYQTRIENAGRGHVWPEHGPYPSLWVAAGGKLSLFDSTITDNRTTGQQDVGMLVDNATASLVRSTFSGLGNPGEADYPLKVSGADSRLTLRDNTFTGNGSDRAQLASNALTGADFTLIPQNGLSGYELLNTLSVPSGMTMTVSPGVTLVGRSGAGLVIQGRLVAERNSGLPIVFTSTTTTAGSWPGVIFDGTTATGSLEGVTIRNGGGSLTGGSSYPAGGLVFFNLASDAVQVRHSTITNASTAGWQFSNSSNLQSATLNGNRITLNTGLGLRLSGTSQVVLANTAILDNDSGGANLDASGTQLSLLHATLARNKVYGLRAATGASATLTNSIFARNAVALRAETGGVISSDTALWDANTTDTAGTGTITSLNRFNGAAAFEPADGYHLTQYSEATAKGKAAILANDMDGSTRPQPAGSLPDLGADEFNQTINLTLSAEKLALPPVWVNRPDASSNPSGALLQQYWIRFHYGSADSQAASLTVNVQDTLPAALTFQDEEHSPLMTFNVNGQQLNWQTTTPLPAQSTVDIQISTLAANPPPGSTITNQAVLTAGSVPFNLSASTLVPVVTPLVTWPADGELCAQPDHALSVEGSAQPGATIEIYEGDIFKGESVVDAKGLFKVNYNGSQAGLAALPLRARACAGGSCSGFTQVNLSLPLSFWDPQRSWWEGDPIVGPMAGKHVTFKFRDQSGQASSTEWIIPGVYGFSDTTLHLYACQDAATSKMPTQIWITADAHVYIPIAVDGPMYTYKIGSAHRVDMQATYRPDPPPDPPDPNDPPLPPDPEYPPEPVIIHDREVWIDPDGYVFNSILGFDPANPTQNVIPGARVTCMAYLPGWGGWVTWPAHLYGGQVNPQVVGSNGYFAFFTPPGQYYLQVDGPDGYQSWRSPVVTVVDEIVHVNIPLTPVSSGPLYTLQSNRAGLSQTLLTVPVGARVRWEITQSLQEDSTSLLADAVNPILRLVSNPDPFASLDGWDSGRLYPGQSYTRQFNHPGDYIYTDSAGHTALIRVADSVSGQKVFIPMIRK